MKLFMKNNELDDLQIVNLVVVRQMGNQPIKPATFVDFLSGASAMNAKTFKTSRQTLPP